MTFSVAGFCERTGMVGVAITSSSICVASRCPWVKAGVGAVSTQNITDPSLGNIMLNLIEGGLSSELVWRVDALGLRPVLEPLARKILPTQA